MSCVQRLAGVPETTLVTPENASGMCVSRNDLFFKPLSGHSSKVVYRGDKVTMGVRAGIAAGGYVAQTFAAPGQRMIKLDGAPVQRKVDIPLYTDAGQILLKAVRLCQGKTTNFRTAGGGFGPVFVVSLVRKSKLWTMARADFLTCSLGHGTNVLQGDGRFSAFHQAGPRPRTPMANLAIVSSSSVRITRTSTRPPAAEISGEFAELRCWSSAIPRKPNPSQIRARTTGEFSPTPPANTS